MILKDKKFLTSISAILLTASVATVIFFLFNTGDENDIVYQKEIAITDATISTGPDGSRINYELNETVVNTDTDRVEVEYISDNEKSNMLEDIINDISEESR